MRLYEQKNRGFSLVELLLVLIITGIIAIMLAPLVAFVQKTVVENIKHKEDKRQIERLRELLRAEFEPLKVFNQIVADINISGYISRRHTPVMCDNCVTGDDTGIQVRNVTLNYDLALVRRSPGRIILSSSNRTSQNITACSFTILTNGNPFLMIDYTNNFTVVRSAGNAQNYSVGAEVPGYLDLQLFENNIKLSRVEGNNVTVMFIGTRSNDDYQFRIIASDGMNCHLSIWGSKFKATNPLVAPSTIVEPLVIRDNSDDVRMSYFLTTLNDDMPSSELLSFTPKAKRSPIIVNNVKISEQSDGPTASIYVSEQDAGTLRPGDLIMIVSTYARQSFIASVLSVTVPEVITAQILTRNNTPIGIYSAIEDFATIPNAFYGAILIQMNYPVHYYHQSNTVFRREKTGVFETESEPVATNIESLVVQQSYNLLRVYISTTSGKSVEEVVAVPSHTRYSVPQ